MLNSIRQKRVLAAASVLFLAGALAAAGANQGVARKLAKIKKQPDGTVSLKQVGNYNDYKDNDDYHAAIKNLTDPDAIAKLKADHNQINIFEEELGGILNGRIERGTSVVTFDVTGAGPLEGFHHVFSMPANFEVHSARNRPGAEIDTFRTNMYRMEGQGSDEMFESIRIVAGTANGYPSPGQMSLISQGDSVLVDSFFNVGFRLEVKGAQGGPFDGIEQTFEGKVTMRSHAADPGTTPEPVKPATVGSRQNR
jgi:hypothetical protein